MDITIQKADMPGTTPAKCNHATGVVYINVNEFYKYPKPHQDFILLHEIGHLAAASHSEFTADEYAYYHFLKLGYTEAQAFEAIYDTLPNPNPEQKARINSILAKTKLLKTKIKPMHNQDLFAPTYPSRERDHEGEQCPNCDSFLGLGKKAQARRDLKVKSNTDAKLIKANAVLEAAKQGIDLNKAKRENTMKIIGGIGATVTSVVGGLTGGGAAAAGAAGAIANLMTVKDSAGNEVPNPDFNPNLPPTNPQGAPVDANGKPIAWYKKTPAIIGMAVGALVVIGAIVYFVKHRN
jgi:hypothetical protein